MTSKKKASSIKSSPIIVGLSGSELRQVFHRSILGSKGQSLKQVKQSTENESDSKNHKKKRTKTVDVSRSHAKFCYKHKSKKLSLDEYITVQFFDVSVSVSSVNHHHQSSNDSVHLSSSVPTPCINYTPNTSVVVDQGPVDDEDVTTMEATASVLEQLPMSTLAIYVRSHPLLSVNCLVNWKSRSAPEKRLWKIMNNLRRLIEAERLGTVYDEEDEEQTHDRALIDEDVESSEGDDDEEEEEAGEVPDINSIQADTQVTTADGTVHLTSPYSPFN